MTDFWEWAVAAYGRPGVADICLSLQDDHGQCVPLLLWAAWRAQTGHGVDSDAAQAASVLSRQWSNEVITPLRTVRRRLKTPLDPDDEAVRLPLREKIKAVELDAEKALMSQLSIVSEKPYLKQGIAEALGVVVQAWPEPVPARRLAGLAEALTKA